MLHIREVPGSDLENSIRAVKFFKGSTLQQNITLTIMTHSMEKKH
jgi:hypothetical protein